MDNHIDEVEGMIEDLKELKKGLMQKLLTQGIGHTEFKDSPVGRIPVEWDIIKFQDMTKILRCGVASTPKYVDKGVIFLSAQNVISNKIILNKYNFISEEYHKQLTKNNKPEKGDILYTRVGANFGRAAVVNLDIEFSVYVSLTHIRLKEGYYSPYYSQLLNSEKYKKHAKLQVFQGGGVPNLNVKIVEKFNMVVPPLSEQKKISEILSKVDERIEKYIEEKNDLQELKKGLMQQLLTGKVRV